MTASAFPLVENHQPRATIVVAQAALKPQLVDSSESKICWAAQELQTYIHKMTGAKLPVAGDNNVPAGPLVLVGPSKLTREMTLAIPSGLTPERKEDGIIINTTADRLVLAGNDAGPYHGTEYAVYDFLNRQGVRWFMPGEFGEYVPQRADLETGNLSIHETPDFRQRCWWVRQSPEMAGLEHRWKLRNKMQPYVLIASPSDASVRNFLAPPEMEKTNLELFARRADGTINVYHPNLTNPETVRIAAGKVKAYFRAHPKESSLGIAPDDHLPHDYNPETLKLNQGFNEMNGREGVPGEMSTSEEWIEWINAITREVKQEFPYHIISTNGYANRNTAPFGVEIDPNISIMFAAIWSDTLHAYDNPRSWMSVRQGQFMQQWTALSDKVWVYGYDYNMLVSAMTPLPTTRKMARDYPLMKKWGIIGFYDESRNAWAERGLYTKYIKARLEWDAEADTAALLNDYFAHWYGPAAKPAQAFWDTLEEAIETTPIQGHEDRVLPWLYTPGLLRKLGAHLAEAQRLAATPREQVHVETDSLILQHLRAYTEMSSAETDGNFAAAAEAGERMLQLRVQLNEIDPFIMPATEKRPDGANEPTSGVWYWTIRDRITWYRDLAARLSGETGDLVKLLPKNPRFSLDPRDEGRFAGWYKTDWKTVSWKTISTEQPFYLQGHLDSSAYPYFGVMWYQFKTSVPAPPAGRRVLLYAPTVETEAWVWVNGKYIGHRPYKESYERPNQMEFDITSALIPGKANTISIRVSTSQNKSALAGGLSSRLFLYSPKP